MQITIGTLYDALQSLGQLAAKELSIKTALKIRRLTRAVQEHVSDANAERDKMIDKFGQKDEQGQLVRDENTIHLADPQGFQAAWSTLLAESVDIEDKLVLRVSDLCDDITVSPGTLIGLGPLLADDE